MKRSDYITGNLPKDRRVMVGQEWHRTSWNAHWKEDVHEQVIVVEGPCGGVDGTICVRYSTDDRKWTPPMPLTDKVLLYAGWKLHE